METEPSYPRDFPAKPYNNILARLAGETRSRESRRELFSAWNAVVYRFRSCAEYDETFAESVRRAGKAPPSPERYIQERELFCFFVTGMSAIECLCYGLFAIGSMLDARAFPFVTTADRRDVCPEMTADKFVKNFPEYNIASVLKQLKESQDYQRWKEMRNILSHRSTPARKIFVGGDHDGDAVWGETIQIDEDTTASRRRWLAETLGNLLEAADVFTAAKFGK